MKKGGRELLKCRLAYTYNNFAPDNHMYEGLKYPIHQSIFRTYFDDPPPDRDFTSTRFIVKEYLGPQWRTPDLPL
jgi:hypothetical protein